MNIKDELNKMIDQLKNRLTEKTEVITNNSSYTISKIQNINNEINYLYKTVNEITEDITLQAKIMDLWRRDIADIAMRIDEIN